MKSEVRSQNSESPAFHATQGGVGCLERLKAWGMTRAGVNGYTGRRPRKAISETHYFVSYGDFDFAMGVQARGSGWWRLTIVLSR